MNKLFGPTAIASAATSTSIDAIYMVTAASRTRQVVSRSAVVVSNLAADRC